MSNSVDAEFPDKLRFLFDKHRYKVAYGGRGSAKSWSYARALLIRAIQSPIRILCAREVQKSIKQSVHTLLADQIQQLGFGRLFTVLETEIRGINGSLFVFSGLANHTVESIKSFEAIDIVWVEEAQTVSKRSWEILIPTIRKDDSEIWVSFNPELEDDETYQRFVVKPPSTAKVVKVNWNDNPWFPEVLRTEMLELKQKDPDAWLNIWEGNCRVVLDGAIYAKELRSAQENGQITKVPYDPTKPVHTFWDLGFADNTAIVMAQSVGFEYRVIDYVQDSQQTINYYLSELQKRPYVWGTDYLPHDAKARSLATGRSIMDILKAAGRKVQIVRMASVADGINAARTIFSKTWFDQNKTADLLQCLRRYRYDTDAKTGHFRNTPLHDYWSHGADAFRMMAVAIQDNTTKKPTGTTERMSYGPQGWMG